MAKELSLDEEDGFSLTSTLRRHMEMLMLLDDILVLSSLSRKRQRIWYCMPESHMDLEVCMRVDSLREYLIYESMITEALRLTGDGSPTL